MLIHNNADKLISFYPEHHIPRELSLEISKVKWLADKDSKEEAEEALEAAASVAAASEVVLVAVATEVAVIIFYMK